MTYFKKIYLTLALSLISSVGYAYGDYGCPSPCEEICQPESCGCGKFFFGAEFLYLRAYEGGLSSVCEGAEICDSSEDGIIVSRLNGRNHDPKYKWHPGFRIGAGYEFANSHCGVGVTWTHLNSNSGKGGKHGDRSGSNLSNGSGSESFSSGSSRSLSRSFSEDSESCDNNNRHNWKVNYDVVDVLFGCDCNCSGCFDVTPYVGLKYARIDQTLHRNFFNFQGEFFTSSENHFKQDFWGIGPLFGVEGEWGLACGLSLYGNISVAFLYGCHRVDTQSTDDFETGRNINHLKNHTQACQSVVDAGLGVRWKTCICDDKFIVLQLGLEEHRYFNYNHFCGYGDLSLSGITVGAGFIF